MKSLTEFILEEKKNYFYGIKPYTIIWHGEWADPEITDGKCTVNYYVVEDSLYEYWKNEIKKEGDTDKAFEEWMKTSEAADMTKEYFDCACEGNCVKEAKEYRENKWLQVGDDEYHFICISKDTRNGFYHSVTVSVNGTNATSYRVSYLNRTWESWTFQSACIGAIEKMYGKSKKNESIKNAVKDELNKNNPNWIQ